MSFSKGTLQLDCQNREAMSSFWSAPSHTRYSGKKSHGLEVKLVLVYFPDSFKCHYILTLTICYLSPTNRDNLQVNCPAWHAVYSPH